MTEQHTSLSTVSAFLDAVQLAGVAFIELQATRVQERSVDLDTMQIGIAQEMSSEAVVLSFRVHVEAESADLVVAVQTRYEFQPVPIDVSDIPESVIKSFIETVGVMSAYPYLRQGISSLSSMLGLPPVTIGLLRAGTVSLDDDALVTESEVESQRV